MYERYRAPLLSRRRFAARVALHGGFALVVIGGSPVVGVLGYMAFAGS